MPRRVFSHSAAFEEIFRLAATSLLSAAMICLIGCSIGGAAANVSSAMPEPMQMLMAMAIEPFHIGAAPAALDRREAAVHGDVTAADRPAI